MDLQFTHCQFFDFAVDFKLESVVVRDRVVKCDQGVGAGHVLDVDDLLFRFAQCMGSEKAQLLEIITIVADGRHQAAGVLFIQFLPPQAEEQGAVLHIRRELVHARHERLGGLVLRVRREGEACKSI